MHYRAKLLTGQIESTADGPSEEKAITRALADSHGIRKAAEEDSYKVALVMFHVYPGMRQPQQVIYATTLGKYYLDTQN